jgi:hypothetical protein
MALSYVMTLQGPMVAPKRRLQLFGAFDPVLAHPVLGLLGLGVGIFFGLRSGKRRR